MRWLQNTLVIRIIIQEKLNNKDKEPKGSFTLGEDCKLVLRLSPTTGRRVWEEHRSCGVSEP